MSPLDFPGVIRYKLEIPVYKQWSYENVWEDFQVKNSVWFKIRPNFHGTYK